MNSIICSLIIEKNHDEEINRDKMTKELEKMKFGKDTIPGCCGALTDAIVVFWIDRNGRKAHDGDISIHFSSIDGKTEEQIPDTELFHIFYVLAAYLSESDDVNEWQKKFCEATKSLVQYMRRNTIVKIKEVMEKRVFSESESKEGNVH